MTHKDEALKLALEALEESETNNDTMEFWDRKTKAITAIQQALATPVQEPVALLNGIKRYEPEIFREDRIRMELDQSGEWVKYADVELFITAPPVAAVPDALNPKDENPAYAAGWNDCRAEMLKGIK